MAHFAELNGDKIVLRVCVVDNNIETSSGKLGVNDKHVDGETWCVNFWGGIWKQTSYNNNFRKQYAGKGMIYDTAKDKFIRPQPYASWSLDSEDDWQAPITYPDDDKEYTWNETAYQADNSTGWDEI